MSDILFWNQVALEVQRLDFSPAADAKPEDKQPEQGGPTRTSRALAIVHAAIYNAWQATTGANPLYLFGTGYRAAPVPVDPGAAVAGAAVAALKDLWPRQTDYIESQLRAFLDLRCTDAVAASTASRSADYGEELTLTLLRARKSDNWDRPDERAYYNAPWHHQPDPMQPGQARLSTHWGSLTPFLINGGAPGVPVGSYLAPPPDWSVPAERTRYEAASADVQALGASQSGTRTPEETLLGIFWGYDGAQGLGVPPRLYNQVIIAFVNHLRTVRGMTISECEIARLFALLNMGMADAAIVAWGAKYHYDLWRPAVGIRQFDPGFGPSHGTGQATNPYAPAPSVSPLCDAHWLPLGIPRTNSTGEFNRTPDFPAYPSGHATFGAVAFRTAALWVQSLAAPTWRKDPEDASKGTVAPSINEIYAENFSFVSDEFDGKNRDPRGDVRPRYARSLSLGGAIIENALSRVYLGVHWRFDGLGTKAPKGLEGMPLPADPAASKSLDDPREESMGGVPAGLKIADEIGAMLPCPSPAGAA